MNDRTQKIYACLTRISPEAVGRAARFACRVAIRLPDEQREAPCAARSQEVERALCGVRNCRGGDWFGRGGRRMRRTSQKWYNMQYINMSGNLPMGIAVTVPRVRYSAAYPTGAERIVFSRVEGVEASKVRLLYQ